MLKTFIATLFIACTILALLLFIPRSYDVPSYNEREGTEYWNLESGSRIGCFKVEGSAEFHKPPIIYLHGGPGGKITDQMIKGLSALSKLGHDLYLYDQVGSGSSVRLKNIKEYSVQRHSNDLAEIVSLIKADEVILLGHSWGALLAVHYLQNHKEKIDKLILSGPGPILPINRKIAKLEPPAEYDLIKPEFSNKEANEKIHNWRSKLVSRWAYVFNSKLASDLEMDQFFTKLNSELSKSTTCTIDNNRIIESGGGYYTHIMTVRSFYEVVDKRESLKNSTTPVLILRGQCDNQKWGFTKEYLDLFKNSELKIIKDAGHDILNTGYEKYMKAIEVFLSS